MLRGSISGIVVMAACRSPVVGYLEALGNTLGTVTLSTLI